MKLVDRNFGINHQALAVMCYLENAYELETDDTVNAYTYLETRPWYNGREKGFMVTLRIGQFPFKHIAVFEHRNSDAICCLEWETEKGYWNWPDENVFEVAYKGETKWDVAKSFHEGCVGECAHWVYARLQEYYNAKIQEVTP